MVFNWIKNRTEQSIFGVFDYVGERFGIQSSKMRLYFIYTTFFTLGSPLILYFITLFWLNIKRNLRKTHISVFN